LNSDIGGGRRIWGLGHRIPPRGDSLAFGSLSPESDPPFMGFWAICSANNRVTLTQSLTTIDITEWHTYTILWEQDNATFLVDGVVVGFIDSPPTVPMGIMIYILNERLYGPSWEQANTDQIDVTVNESIQIDYVEVFTSRERFEETSGMFAQAQELILLVEQKGGNTETVNAKLENAKEFWREGHYVIAKANNLIDTIVTDLDYATKYWDEIHEMFPQANQCIETLKASGNTRDEQICRAFYSKAVGSWDNYHYEATRNMLDNIIVKCPEPMILLIFYLILLPALQRARRYCR
jgi:hypothetical protein